MRAANGGDEANHSGDGVADIGTAVDAESIEYAEQVVDVGVEGVILYEVKVIRIYSTCAGKIVEDDAETLLPDEEREDTLPR